MDRMDLEAFRARQAEWDRFHEWETEHPVDEDLDAKWRWYEAAWQLALDAGASPTVPHLDHEKLRHLSEVRARLAGLPWPS